MNNIDMTLFILCGNRSTFSTRFYMLSLTAFILICFCSYCSSSSLIAPVIDVNPLDEFENDDEINYRFSLPSLHYLIAPEQPILPSKNRFLHLFKSMQVQPEYRYRENTNNKRYLTQSFHAMRG